jgi:hypothetical protein
MRTVELIVCGQESCDRVVEDGSRVHCPGTACTGWYFESNRVGR